MTTNRQSTARKPEGHPGHGPRQGGLEGVSLIQSVLGGDGRPVIGLYIYTACGKLMKSLSAKEFRQIKPPLIGTPAILSVRPGISQTELARHLSVERATAGKQVSACIARGWVKRTIAADDRRRFSLFITPKGEQMLRGVIATIALHESRFTRMLDDDERRMLQALLHKIIQG